MATTQEYIEFVDDGELTQSVIEEPAQVTPVPKPKAKKQTSPSGPDVIKNYIASQRDEIQPLLHQVYDTIRTALPGATEKISWQMPTFWQRHNLIHFAAQKNHLGIYPGVAAMEHFGPRLTDYKTSKGAIQFPYKTFGKEQLALISEIAVWCGKTT